MQKEEVKVKAKQKDYAEAAINLPRTSMMHLRCPP